MSTGQRKTDTILIVDRRRNGRFDRCDELTLAVDSQSADAMRTVQAWSFNLSRNGVRFRCREVLPDEILVQFQCGFTTEATIAHRMEVGTNLWDYGVSLADEVPDSVFVESDDDSDPQMVEIPARKKVNDDSAQTVQSLREATAAAQTQNSRRRRKAGIIGWTAAASFTAAVPLLVEYDKPEMFFCVLGLAMVATVAWLGVHRPHTA